MRRSLASWSLLLGCLAGCVGDADDGVNADESELIGLAKAKDFGHDLVVGEPVEAIAVPKGADPRAVRFSAAAGEDVEISVHGAGGGFEAEIYDLSGARLKRASVTAPHGEKKLSFTAPAAGTYRVVFRGYRKAKSFITLLRSSPAALSAVASRPDADVAVTTTPAPGVYAAQHWDDKTKAAAFEVTANPDELLSFRVNAAWLGGGDVWLIAPNGRVVERANGARPVVLHTAREAGVYRLVVRGTDPAAGSARGNVGVWFLRTELALPFTADLLEVGDSPVRSLLATSSKDGAPAFLLTLSRREDERVAYRTGYPHANSTTFFDQQETRWWTFSDGAYRPEGEGKTETVETGLGASIGLGANVFGDFNGDGRLDTIYGGKWRDAILDTTVPNLAPVSVTGDQPLIAALDVDGDGRDELVGFRSPYGFEVSRAEASAEFLGFRDFKFSPNHRSRPPSAMVTADLDGDGRKEIVLLSYLHSELEAYKVAPDGSVSRTPIAKAPIGEHPYEDGVMRVGDVDGDGAMDVVYYDYQRSSPSDARGVVRVFYGNRQGAPFERTSTHLLPDNLPRVCSISVADLDDDGRVELVASMPGSLVRGTIAEADESIATTRHHTGIDACRQGAVDVDGDGRADLVFPTGTGLAVLRRK